MTRWARLAAAAALATAAAGAACVGTGPEPAPAVPAGVKAFIGATVIDGTGAAPIAGAVMVVSHGRIDAVGPAGTVEVPAGAERVDLSGRTVMPGIVNAHGHVGGTVGLESGPALYTADNVLRQLALYARYGVTTVNSLGDDQAAGFEVRDTQGRETLDRARLFAAGPVIDAETPEMARDAVDAVAKQGARGVASLEELAGALDDKRAPRPVMDAVSALVNLGYNPSQALGAVSRAAGRLGHRFPVDDGREDAPGRVNPEGSDFAER